MRLHVYVEVSHEQALDPEPDDCSWHAPIDQRGRSTLRRWACCGGVAGKAVGAHRLAILLGVCRGRELAERVQPNRARAAADLGGRDWDACQTERTPLWLTVAQVDGV